MNRDLGIGRLLGPAALVLVLAVAIVVPAAESAAESVTAKTLVSCEDGLPGEAFEYGVLRKPRTAERSRTAAARALRRFLRKSWIAEGMPRRRWFVLTRRRIGDVSEIKFASGRLHSLATVTFERKRGGRWRWFGSSEGENCNLRRISATGQVAAPWFVDPLRLPLDPATTSLTVVMSEVNCNSGAPAGDRASVPLIEYRPDAIVLIGQIVPDDGAHTCPSNPPTYVTVQLNEPIGDRALIDGGGVPANSQLSTDQLVSLRGGADPAEVLLFQTSDAEFCRDIHNGLGQNLVSELTKVQYRRLTRRAMKCR